jgi:hypothetical protein
MTESSKGEWIGIWIGWLVVVARFAFALLWRAVFS